MGLNVSNKGGNFTLCPPGPHAATCVMVADLGTQPETYMGKAKAMRKIRIGFELDETHVFDESKGPEPFNMSKKYTASLTEKSNLYKDLISWRGKPFTPEELKDFDLTRLIGKSCCINVVHEPRKSGDGTVSKIATIMPMMKGMKGPVPTKEPYFYKIEDGNGGNFSKLPEWIQKEVKMATEFAVHDPNHADEDAPNEEDDSDSENPF